MYERFFRTLYRIRRVEEEIAKAYPTDRIKSPVHLSIGQEAVSVGVCEALEATDIVFGTYRGHAMYLAKGGDLKAMIAELFGRSTGCTHGKGGSMHLINIEKGVLGTSAVVGTTIANAAGYAYAVKCRGSGALVVSFFGDGATEEGVFAETLNFAALKALPITFVCENNQYAIHTHQSRRQGVPQICERARSLGVTAERVEHSDVLYLHERVRAVSPSVRAGRPYFFEVMTYRWREHVGPDTDYQLGYRTEDEAASWLSADQLTRMANLVQPLQRSRIQQEVDEEIAEAFAFAEASPVPEAAELYTDVFKES